MLCPFCQYQRSNDDAEPSWMCPNCKKAYSKYKVRPKSESFSGIAHITHTYDHAVEATVAKYGGVVLLVWLFIGLFSKPICNIQDEIVIPTIKILFLPVIIVLSVVFFLAMPSFRRKIHPIKYISGGILLSLLVAFSGIGQVTLFNQFMGTSEAVAIEGEIVERIRPSVRYRKITVLQKNSSEYIELEICAPEFRELKKGGFYSALWHKGSLGILYKHGRRNHR